MHFGVFCFCTDETISPPELAKAAEDRGFESLFLPEHTHVPAKRVTPWAGGAELPRYYYRVLDPFVSLAAAAAVTERLRIGTGVCLVVERDPIIVAKEVATLDQLSQGRVIFGVGAGWSHEEMRNHGTDPKRRFGLLRERVLAIKALWTDEQASAHGEFVNFDPVYQWPKPVQRPHPPVLLGGMGPRVLDRVLDYADGWYPNARDTDIATLGERIAELRRMAEQRGAPQPSVSVCRAAQDAEALERYASFGVDRCVFALPQGPAGEAIAALDDLAKLTAPFRR